VDENDRETAQREIQLRLHEINRAWLEGRLEQLGRFFDPGIVMVAPGFGAKLAGADTCLASFEEFIASAGVRRFKESEITAEVWGSTAVGSFRFDVTYVLNGNEQTEAGREIWVFARGEEGWRAVWRTQIPIR
jgi:hypothetical protein